MATRFTVQQHDVTALRSDLLLLKHAHGFHGADQAVARILINSRVCTEREISREPDDFAIVPTENAIRPARVMFLGTPNLRDFSYPQMEHFAARAIEILADQGQAIRLLTTTVHGVNYGLDASESLQSLTRGFREGLARHPQCRIDDIAFVEKNERTARILKLALETMDGSSRGTESPPSEPVLERQEVPRPAARDVPKRPAFSEAERIPVAPPQETAKRHVFVAMPFSEEFQDIYEFEIYGPIRKCGFICERVDEASFTGDILQRIIDRISTSEFVIAELSGARANVYLEVGYAWGKGIPVITLAREGEKLHFDVSTHRCIFYRTIGQLAKELEKLVRGIYHC